MSNQMPPVPPAGRSNKGPGRTSIPAGDSDDAASTRPSNRPAKGQENIKQNTTNQGYQQDR